MKILSCFLRSLFASILLLSGYSSYATHIVGVDLSYSYVTGNTYTITLVAYGDCAGASFPSLPLSAPVICIYDGNTSVSSISLTLQPPTAGVEITPVCPADISKTQCTNPAFAIPGIKKFVFTGTYTLPYTSAVWRFLFTGNMGPSGGSAGRGSTITNIVGPGTSVIQLVDTLNNITYHNTSPALTVLPTPFFCLNNPDTYNPGASDPDHDSLSFFLVPAINGTTSCAALGSAVTYVSPYTATAPLATSSFLFDPKTGQITFTPNILQRSLVVYNIEEYRSGTMVGSCQREMTFLVLTCTTAPPWGGYKSATAGTIVDSVDFSICSNVGPFSITMIPKEPDTTNFITVTPTGLPTGITFTTVNNGTNHPVCTISGNTTSMAPGTYIYYVTFQDNACPLNGVRTQAFTITVLPAPTVTVSPGVSICQGASTTLTAAGASSYSWTPGTGLSCTACASTVASPAATTLYTVTGTATNGCTDVDTVRVTILPLPVLTISPPATICTGANVPLSVSGAASYVWSPATGLSCTTCTNPTATPPATITYSVTGTGANGCVNKTGTTVKVNPLPTITILPAAICSGVSATLFPSGAVSYVWTPATGLSCTACTNPVTSVTVTTTYTVTGTDVNGCKDTASVKVNVSPTPLPPGVVSPLNYCQNAFAPALTATGASLLWYAVPTGGTGSTGAPVPSTATPGSTTWYVSQTVGGCESARSPITVTINALPVITISPATAAICIGADTTLTAAGGVSYVWSPGTGLSTTTGSVVKANPTSATTYTVTGTNSNGCTNTASELVTVNPLPTITIPSATICNGSSTTLTAAGAVTYLWSPTATLSSSVGTSVIASPSVTTTYIVTGTDANNCVNAALTTVTVNPIPPMPTVVSPVVYCQNAAASALKATGTALLWYTLPAGGTPSTIAPVPPTTTVGVTTWYVSQTLLGCESPRDSITVTINPLPVVTISPTGIAFCAGNNAVMTASGAITYSWLPSAGLSSITSATVTAGPTTTTLYTVTGTDAKGCSNTATQNVVVNPLPVITVESPSICIGSSATLTASGASTYTWSPSATLSAASGASVIATPTITSSYTITGTDINGCISTAVATVTVNAIPSAPDVLSPLFYCQHVVAPVLTATGINLLWYTAATGGTGTSAAPIPVTDNADSTTWYVSQTVNGCESPRDSILIIVKVNAQTDFSYTIRYGCINDTVQFTNNSINAYRYLWNFGDNTTDTATNPVHYYEPVKQNTDFTVTLWGYNEYCFPDSTIKVLTLEPTPPLELINVSPSQTVPYATSVTLNADGANTYLWTPDNGTLSDIHIHNPIATPIEDITYIVTGTDLRGCIDTASVHITLEYEDNPFLPSAFTPNGDGENDLARILNLKYNKLVAFRIFNRWGQVVFYTTDVNEGWDGTFNGSPQDLGVYQYLFSTTHPDGRGLRSYKGNITLIR